MKVKSLILFIFVAASLFSSIVVEFNSNLQSDIIQTEKIEKVEYFKANELNKVFHSVIKDDILDQRLLINIYGQQFIFLLDSAYLQFRDKIYNLRNSIILKNGKYFLPINFLTDILPSALPEKLKYIHNKIVAETPIDNSIRKIVIDPGHGGKDPGAIGFSKKNLEKEIALTIAEKVKNKLSENLDVEVMLTRDKDEFVSLQSRTKFANEKGADLFISIHCNAHRSNTATGIEVYYLSTAKTSDERAVEALENSVVYDYEGGEEAVQKYNDLQLILADMAQNEHLEESYDLAMELQDDLVTSTYCFDRGVKQANFYVLRGAFMPAVLIETGFLSNADEEKKLSNANYQNKIAQSIFEGIKSFKLKYDQMQ